MVVNMVVMVVNIVVNGSKHGRNGRKHVLSNSGAIEQTSTVLMFFVK